MIEKNIPKNVLMRSETNLNKIARKELIKVAKRVIITYGFFCKSILIIGSFSKGSASLEKTNKGVKIHSDFDFLLVTHNLGRLFLRFFPFLKKQLNNVDLHFIPQTHLKKLKSTYEYVDWKNTGKVIWGNASVLDELNLKKENITKDNIKEILILRKKNLENFSDLDEEKKRQILKKIIFALGDWALIQKEKYSSYLSVKFKMLKENCKNESQLIQYFDKMLKFQKEPENHKFETRQLYKFCSKKLEPF